MPHDLQRLYIAPEQHQGDRAQLTPVQCHYLYRVLRLAEGDRLIVLDGQGAAWLAELAGTEAILSEAIAVSTELPLQLTLIVALPKGSGFEEIIRCGTELGVTTFCPVMSDRTLPKPNPKKLARWQKIATEAAEQSERALVPTVEAVRPFRELLQGQGMGAKYLCVARGDVPSLGLRIREIPSAPLGKGKIPPAPLNKGGITVATGPEGGWTAEEIEQAIAVGFQPVSLGARVLRAVTAPIAAVAVVASWLESEQTGGKF
ncbi:MAG: 16S rRNA (uracil(1498)-N(3))-methyltransferase [Spirulina sp. SIO3F2]|nr:16S rRNA (uracil(1498)-N(3))-methyltransferase [Spirulina sp. SIO3F2]